MATVRSRPQASHYNEKLGVSVALLVARRTNNRKVVGSMPANVACITANK